MSDNQREHDRSLMEAIALGVEAKNFVEGRLFRFICNAAEARVIDAQNQLGMVDPTDTKEIVRLQTVIKHFNHFANALQEMVAVGDSAYQLYLQTNSQKTGE